MVSCFATFSIRLVQRIPCFGQIKTPKNIKFQGA
jgi:hypothetical protein